MFFAGSVPPSARSAYRRDALAGMLGAVFGAMVGPFIMVIARKTLKASPLEIVLLIVMPNAGYLLTLAWARLMDGRPKMPFAVFSWVSSRCLFFAAVFVTCSWSFVAMMSAYYLLMSIANPAYSVLMKEIYPDSDRARIMGYARVCTLGAFAPVSLIAGRLLHGHNYQIVFPIAAVFGIVSALVFRSIRVNETIGASDVPLGHFIKDSVLVLRENKGFRRFCAGIFISGFANIMVGPLIALYQIDTLGVDTNWAAVFAFVTSPVAMTSYIYWGKYIDRRTSNEAVGISTILLACVPVCYCVATQAWMVVPIALLVAALNGGFELGYANGVLQYAPDDKIAVYQALFYSLMGIRGIIAPFVGVALVESGLMPMKSVFIMCAGVMLLGAAIQFRGTRVSPQT